MAARAEQTLCVANGDMSSGPVLNQAPSGLDWHIPGVQHDIILHQLQL